MSVAQAEIDYTPFSLSTKLQQFKIKIKQNIQSMSLRLQSIFLKLCLSDKDFHVSLHYRHCAFYKVRCRHLAPGERDLLIHL